MMEKLKPCPFCPDGGEPKHITGSSYEYGSRAHAVECCKCGVVGPVRGTEAEAIEAWNRRANDADQR
jgi:Lar family restriction alleviation protein